MKTPFLALVGVVASLAACSTPMKIGDSSAKTAGTGSAGGANAQNENKQLEKCDKTMGTVALVEDQHADWWYRFRDTKLQSTVPVMRMLVQQSNCFVVIERGLAMRNMMQEREISQSGEMRDNSNFQKGQMVAADYTINPTITFSDKTGGMGGLVGGLLGPVGALVGGSLKFNEASVMMVMVDNRSGVQLAAAEGSSKNMDVGMIGGLFGGVGFAGASGWSKTPEGKVLTAAFLDSYNQLVKSVKNYKAQKVEGGLGTGGTIGVDGGATPASQKATKKTK
jgi:hypothetical protein